MPPRGLEPLRPKKVRCPSRRVRAAFHIRTVPGIRTRNLRVLSALPLPIGLGRPGAANRLSYAVGDSNSVPQGKSPVHHQSCLRRLRTVPGSRTRFPCLEGRCLTHFGLYGVVPPPGFEPGTSRFVAGRSSPLSYRGRTRCAPVRRAGTSAVPVEYPQSTGPSRLPRTPHVRDRRNGRIRTCDLRLPRAAP